MITEDKIIALQLQTQSTNTPEYILKKLIEEHDTREMEDGVRYYHNENKKIKSRQIYIYDDQGRKMLDPDAVNERIPHNWHKLLVDQKVSYLLGKPPVVNANPDDYAEVLNEWLDEDFDDKLQELGKNSSNKGAEYLHPYIDEDGSFKYVVIPREQSIPIYDQHYQEEIVGFIRFYPVWVNDKERIRAEWWTKEDVTYYIQQDSGIYELEDLDRNPDSHFYYNGNGYGWGKVPFVGFANNEEKYSDLKYYKEIIDIYDLVVSDMANDLVDIQKMLYVLRGYQGTSLAEFMTNLRRYRAIKVDAEQGAGVDTVSANIDTQAIDSFLDRQEENIFLFGQGVNVKTDRFGNSPSGIALKFLFHLLDLKANIMARKFAFGVKEFIWFLTEYLGISGKYSAPQDAIDSVKITFTKSMLVNDLELVDMAMKSNGIISKETIVANHPWTEDANEEIERMEKEREEYLQSEIQLNPLEDEEDEEEI